LPIKISKRHYKIKKSRMLKTSWSKTSKVRDSNHGSLKKLVRTEEPCLLIWVIRRSLITTSFPKIHMNKKITPRTNMPHRDQVRIKPETGVRASTLTAVFHSRRRIS
jgi:hypothetical protein